ncbi:serine hydrolase [Paenibacillus sp. GCM10027627]|uniref:serine hydrolase n=1 Tax=unclassified Paenibacillus TaxID=185978 RepID=UPI003639A47C
MKRGETIRKKTSKWAMAALAVTVACSVALTPHGTAKAAASTGPKDAKEVEAFADAFFQNPEIKDHMAGGAFVVVADNKVLLNKGYGYADVKSKKPVVPDTTVFRMASVGKVFTAAAVMQLVEEGKVNLDEDIHTYLGGVKIPNQTGGKLTMRHLLSHTSGFNYTDVEQGVTSAPSDYTLGQYVTDNTPTVVRKPGEAYRYDNMAYAIAGYVVEKVSGKPFEQFVKERIFGPLQMKGSSIELTDSAAKNLATSYKYNDEPYELYYESPPVRPEGSMVATSSDISNFMLAYLNGGKLGDSQILKPETVKEMSKTQVAINPVIPNSTLGLEMADYESFNGQNFIQKGGDVPGFHSMMWLLPDQKVGAFFITNDDGVEVRGKLVKAFMDHYYPHKEEPRKVVPMTKQQLLPYEGVYNYLRIPLYRFTVEAKDGYLSVKAPSALAGPEPVKLFPVGDGLFQDEQGRLGAFKQNEAGQVEYLHYLMPYSWTGKVLNKPTYRDVPNNHPYATAIQELFYLGADLNPKADKFQPDAVTTRAEFAAQITKAFSLKPSVRSAVFKDVKGHRYAGEVQTLFDLGVIQGNSKDKFHPDRPIKREEAAVLIHRIMVLNQFPAADADLTGKTSPWAVEAVKNVVGYTFYGPDVIQNEKGVDYRSKDTLLRKEAALLLTKFTNSLM